MNIALYSIFSPPELTGVGKYNGELLEYLAAKPNSIYAVLPPPYYPELKVFDGYSAWAFSTQKINNLTIYRCPLFIPSRMTPLSRIFHYASFSLTSLFGLCRLLNKKIDVIIMTQPTLFCSLFALIFSRISGAKAILHIQDYEVDAMVGLNMAKQGFMVSFARYVEKWLMRKFDAVSTISFSMMEIAKGKGVDPSKLIFFPNWADVSFITPFADKSLFRQIWEFPSSDKIILYSGNIGKKQGLEVVITAAEYLREQSNIKFLIVGSGSHKETLETLVRQKNLSNVFFKPLQPWDQVPALLAAADIHLVIQKRGVADVVLPSKLTNILAAGGQALVTAEDSTELGVLNEKYPGIFHLVDPENDEAFIQGLENLLSQNFTTYNKVARKYAEENLSKTIILSRFEQDLQSLIAEDT